MFDKQMFDDFDWLLGKFYIKFDGCHHSFNSALFVFGLNTLSFKMATDMEELVRWMTGNAPESGE